MTATIVLSAAILAAILLAPFFGSHATQGGGPSGLTGETVPIVALRDDGGTPVSVAAYRGRIVVMNLWASWCPPCRAELPDLQRLSERYRTRGVAVVGVNQGESAQRARSFARSLDIGFPVWIDERQQYGRAYAALGLPTTVVIGRDGTIVRGFDGPIAYAQMRDAVDAALAGTPHR